MHSPEQINSPAHQLLSDGLKTNSSLFRLGGEKRPKHYSVIGGVSTHSTAKPGVTSLPPLNRDPYGTL